MERKVKTFMRIKSIYDEIKADKNFPLAVSIHCKMILNEFARKKLFYKFIFSNNRFIIATITASVYYSQEDASLAEVSRQCLKTGMVSLNTVSSLLTLFKVSGRIRVCNSNKDLRKKLYMMTEKGIEDALCLLNTMTPSLKTVFPESLESEYLSSFNLPFFFKRYAEIHESSVFLINLVQDVEIFIAKDSGHMVLVNIYMLGICNENSKDTISSIAKRCGISRTHLRSMISEAEARGLLMLESKSNKIIVYEEFFSMFNSYMAYYFSFFYYGMEGILEKDIQR
ncbi:hypothetical protein [Pantoea dispersa]|uniref:hypothetical protein n=1 Tax=Pantoea dispersa TaxID=59814 RepID=UPI0024AF6A1D|nr:hypothetical protein [Pantoea dispersa]MDI6636468.1 hypothetical protein [Pantoea dispersa]